MTDMDCKRGKIKLNNSITIKQVKVTPIDSKIETINGIEYTYGIYSVIDPWGNDHTGKMPPMFPSYEARMRTWNLENTGYFSFHHIGIDENDYFSFRICRRADCKECNTEEQCNNMHWTWHDGECKGISTEFNGGDNIISKLISFILKYYIYLIVIIIAIIIVILFKYKRKKK